MAEPANPTEDAPPINEQAAEDALRQKMAEIQREALRRLREAFSKRGTAEDRQASDRMSGGDQKQPANDHPLHQAGEHLRNVHTPEIATERLMSGAIKGAVALILGMRDKEPTAAAAAEDLEVVGNESPGHVARDRAALESQGAINIAADDPEGQPRLGEGNDPAGISGPIPLPQLQGMPGPLALLEGAAKGNDTSAGVGGSGSPEAAAAAVNGVISVVAGEAIDPIPLPEIKGPHADAAQSEDGAVALPEERPAGAGQAAGQAR